MILKAVKLLVLFLVVALNGFIVPSTQAGNDEVTVYTKEQFKGHTQLSPRQMVAIMTHFLPLPQEGDSFEAVKSKVENAKVSKKQIRESQIDVFFTADVYKDNRVEDYHFRYHFENRKWVKGPVSISDKE